MSITKYYENKKIKQRADLKAINQELSNPEPNIKKHIAALNYSDINSIALQATHIVEGTKKYYSPVSKNMLDDKRKFLEKYKRLFDFMPHIRDGKDSLILPFDGRTVKVQLEGGIKDIRYAYSEQTKSYTNIALSLGRQQREYKNYTSGKKSIYVFDLETLGDGRITEFSFLKKNAKTKETKEVTNIIGITKQTADNYRTLLSRFLKDRHSVTHEELITLQRFNLIGASEYTYDETNKNYYFTKFNNDAKFNTEHILKGISDTEKIGAEQRSRKVKYMGETMYAHEKQYLEIMKDMTKNKGILFGHNIQDFDTRRSDNYFMGDDVSEGARTVYKKIFPKSMHEYSHKIDTMSALVQGIPEKEYQNELNYDLAKQIHLHGDELRGHNIQNAMLVRAGIIPDEGAHSSLNDIKNLVKIVDTDFMKDLMSKKVSRSSALKFGDIFNIRDVGKISEEGKFGNLSFGIDGFDGKLRFYHAGVALNNSGTSSEHYIGQKIFQKDMNYAFGGINKITLEDDGFFEELKNIDRDVANAGELYTANFMEVSSIPGQNTYKESYRAGQKITVVGTKENIQQMMNGMFRIGSMSDENLKEVYKLYKEAEKNNPDFEDDFEGLTKSEKLEMISRYSFANKKTFTSRIDKSHIEDITMFDEQGKEIRPKFKGKSPKPNISNRYYNLAMKLQENAIDKRSNESAARKMRDNNYKFDKTVFALEDELAGLSPSEKRQYLQEVLKEASNVARMISNGEKIDTKKLQNTLIDGLSFNRNGNLMLYSNTIDSLMESFNQNVALRPLKQAIMDKLPEDRVKDYSDIVRIALVNAQSRIDSNDIFPKTKRPLIGERERNAFDIDLTKIFDNFKFQKVEDGFNSQDPNIVTFNTNEMPNQPSNRIIDKLFGSGYSKNVSTVDKKKYLLQVMEHIKDEYNLDFHPLEGKKIDNIDEHQMAVMFGKMLNHVRQNDPSAGRLRDTSRQTVHDVPAIADIIKNKDILDEIVNESFEAFDSITKIKKSSLNVAINDIVNQIVFKETKNIDEEILRQYGYSDTDIQKLMRARNMRMDDTRKMLESVFKRALDGTGLSLNYDIDSGHVWLRDSDNKITMLDNLIGKDLFDATTGVMYRRTGNKNASNVLGVYNMANYNDTTPKFEVATSLKKAYRTTSLKGIDRAIDNGENVASAVSRYFSKINKAVMQMSTYNDAQDVVAAGLLDVNDVIENASFIASRTNILDDIDIPNKKAVVDAMLNAQEGSNARKNIFASGTRGPIMSGITRVVQAIFNDKRLVDTDSDNTLNQLFTDALTTNKALRKGMVKILESDYTAGSDTGNNVRHIREHSNKARKIKLDKFNDSDNPYLDNETKSSILIGRTVGTQVQNSRTKGSDFDTAIRVNRLALDYRDLHDIFTTQHSVAAQVLNESQIMHSQDAVKTLESFIESKLFIEEGGAIIDPAVFDTFFNDRLSMSTFKNDTVDYSQITEREQTLRENALFRLDDNLKFSYGNGTAVERGEDLLTHKTYESIKTDIAKSDGILKGGFFNTANNELVDEKTINGILASEETIERIDQLRKADHATRMNEIEQILEEHGLKYKYYLRDNSINPFRKLIESESEKNMSNAAMVNAGKLDLNIRKTLQDLGVKSYEPFNTEILDSLLTDFEKNQDFATIAKKSTDEVLEVLKQNGYNSAKDFGEAILKERYLPFKALSLALVKDGIINEEDHISLINNNIKANVKHGDVINEISNKINNMIAYNTKQGMTNEEAVEKTANELKQYKIFNADDISLDGQTITLHGKNKDYNIAGLEQMQQDLYKDMPSNLRQTKRSDGSIANGLIDKVSVSASYDFDKASDSTVNKGYKASSRLFENLLSMKYTTEGLEAVKAHMNNDEKFNETYGHMINYGSDGSIKLKDEYEGKPVNEALAKNLHQRAFAADINNKQSLLMVNGQISKPSIINKFAKEEHIDKKFVYDLLNNLRDEHGIQDVDKDYTAKAYAIQQGGFAMKHNAGMAGYDENYMLEHNFSKISLKDLVTSQYANDSVDNAIYGKSVLLDLEGTGFTVNGQSTVALPYEQMKYLDKSTQREARTNLQSVVGSIQSMVNDRDYEVDPEKIQNLNERIQQKIDELPDMVENITKGKEGYTNSINNFRLGASVNNIKLYLQDQFVNLINQDDKELSNMNVKIGMGRFDSLFGEQIQNISKMGFDESEVRDFYINYLKDNGVVGTNKREPLIYTGSVLNSKIFLDENIVGDQSVVSITASMAQNGDIDGDAKAVQATLAKANVSNENKTSVMDLDEAGYKFLQHKNISVESDIGEIADMSDATRRYIDVNYVSKFHSPQDGNSSETLAAHANNNFGNSEKYAINGKIYTNNNNNTQADRDAAYRKWNNLYDNGLGEHLRSKGFENDIFDIGNEDELISYKNEAAEYIKANITNERDFAEANEALGRKFTDQLNALNVIKEQAIDESGLLNNSSNTLRVMAEHISRTPDIQTMATTRDSRIFYNALSAGDDLLSMNAKNASGDSMNTVKRYGDAINTFLGFNGGERDVTPLLDLFEEQGILESSKFTKAFADGEAIPTRDEVKSSFEKMIPIDRKINKDYVSLIRQTTAKNAANHKDLVYSESSSYIPSNTTISALDSINEGRLANDISIFDMAAERPNTSSLSEVVTLPDEEILSREDPTVIGDTVKKLSSTLSKHKKNLAMGALGLAGATMLAGFAGGDPSKADYEARQAYTPPPRLSDFQGGGFPQNSSPGYVININADTSEGQSHVTNAVNQAFQSNFNNTNLNIRMNMNNDTSNITSRDIINYISSTL